MTLIQQLPSTDRPRERLVSVGREALSEVELVTLVFGGQLRSAVEVVTRLGGSMGIRRALLPELCAIPGVGMVRACQLQAAIELGCRSLSMESDRGESLRTPSQVRERLRDLEVLEQEELHVLGLDTRHRLITRFTAARGAANVVHVSARDVYRRLVREGAVAAIVAHNHPGGDPTPSSDDAELTQRLRAAGELVGVPLLDHLVIAADGYFSFSDERLVRNHR